MVITRKEALAKGLNTYYTGKPCKRNHKAFRYITKSECLECRKERYLCNQDKYRSLNKVWKKEHKGAVYANNRSRELRKQAVKWANLEKIKEIYQQCPKGYVVDHFIPLHGKYICGLHVENNLQYLTREENQAKKAKFMPYIQVTRINLCQ